MADVGSTQQRSISDDDLCATCGACGYLPGSESTCSAGFPGEMDADGYVIRCESFERVPDGKTKQDRS